MRSVDLNCDCGEGFGAYRIGDDAAMLDIVTSVNVACGFHAGDPEIMAQTFAAAKAKGIAIGAHPGFPDLRGFGRRSLPFTTGEIERLVAYQIGAAQVTLHLCRSKIGLRQNPWRLEQYRGRGCNDRRSDRPRGQNGREGFDVPRPRRNKIGGGRSHARAAVAREIFADRAYTDAGRLVDRACAGAVLHNVTDVASRALAMISDGAIITESGKRLAAGIDSICVHGDSPNAVAMAKAIRARLEDAGIGLAPFARTK